MSHQISESDRREYLAAALTAVAESRAIILDWQAAGFSTRTKADSTYVTDADLEAEQALRGAIMRRFPQHGIIGEEFPPVNADSDFQWILDPIDGTLSFTRGIPLFGTIVALHFHGTPVVGVIDHPRLGLCYSAAVGLGAFCNGSKVRITDPVADGHFEREIVAVSDRAQFTKTGKTRAFDALMRKHPCVRTYPDCFGHTLAATGAVGATVDFGLKIWDLAATRVLIEEAGGKYVVAQELKGGAQGTLYGIICGKPRVVDWLVPLFA